MTHSTESFIKKAKEVHGDKFDYKLLKWSGCNNKVEIICRTHGSFWQLPSNHIKGCGCNKCSKNVQLSNDDFISRSVEKHQGVYSYNKTNYVDMKTKATITCSVHGDFYQLPSIHLRGAGCIKCAGVDRHTTCLVIQKFISVHGDKYGYEKVEYKNLKTKILIRCQKHGYFEQAPTHHLQGKGCMICGGCYRLSSDLFVQKSIKVHGARYSYEKVKYINNRTNICITCVKHGDFLQTPQKHLSGHGCHECGKENNNKSVRLSTKQFIEKAKEKHGLVYDYSLVDYVNAHKKIKIICKIHGEFQQNPDSHLRGAGCSKCVGSVSRPEIELVNLINSHGLEVLENKSINNGKGNIFRFDCVIPKKKVAIEFNGLYWHSTANKHVTYHQEKREHAEKNGYRLVTIWEDEWLNNKKAVNTKLIKILAGKEDIARGKEIVLDLDYQCYKKYLRQGYKITSIAPVARRRWQAKKGHTCFNSGVAILRKA